MTDDKLRDFLEYFCVEIEGGYTDDPDDKGGETKYGITARSYPSLNIKDLTLEDAIFIYKRDYWASALCDKLPLNLAVLVFDMSVNSGLGQAISTLQRACRTFGCFITVDGIFGAETYHAVKSIIGKEGGSELLFGAYIIQRCQFYNLCIQKDLSQLKFMTGWNNRLRKLTQYLFIV